MDDKIRGWVRGHDQRQMHVLNARLLEEKGRKTIGHHNAGRKQKLKRENSPSPIQVRNKKENHQKKKKTSVEVLFKILSTIRSPDLKVEKQEESKKQKVS